MVRFVVFALILSHSLLARNSEGQSTQQAPDTTLWSDPQAGELFPALPASAVTTPPAVGTTSLTDDSIIALARADARRHHSDFAWRAGGGLLGAAAMFYGGLVGINGPFPLILIGAGVGAIIVPMAVSYAPVTVPALEKRTEASPAQVELYRQTFIAESRRLRRISVVIGELVLGALEGVYMLYLFYFTPWPYS